MSESPAKNACNFSPAREVAVKNYFRAYKRAVIRAVGRGQMYKNTIEKKGRTEFGKRWAGVLTSDQTDGLLQMRDRFAITNTATSKGLGSHWLGFYIISKGVAYQYDSFGRSLARVDWLLSLEALQEHVALRGTDPAAEQRGSSALCGQLSLSWLLTVRNLEVKATAAAV